MHAEAVCANPFKCPYPLPLHACSQATRPATMVTHAHVTPHEKCWSSKSALWHNDLHAPTARQVQKEKGSIAIRARERAGKERACKQDGIWLLDAKTTVVGVVLQITDGPHTAPQETGPTAVTSQGLRERLCCQSTADMAQHNPGPKQ